MKRLPITILVLAIALVTVTSDSASTAGFGTPAAASLNMKAGDSSYPQKSTGDELREEFHQTYPLTANGRVSLENINGGVHIAVWDQNEVKVDAVKRAYRRERL